MPFTLTMPKLSPTMELGTLVKWHKREGDHVKVNDLLMEVATDKATVEFNAFDAGWISKILIQEGQEAQVNQALAIMTDTKGESIEGYRPEGLQPVPAKVPPITPAPAAAQGCSSLLAPAEAISPSPAVTSGGLLQPVFSPEPPLEHYVFDQPTGGIDKRIFASPLARRLAKERGLDLSTVKGSGPRHRIMSRDLEKAQPAGIVAFGHREKPKHQPGSYSEEPLSPMRKVIGQRLQESKSFVPHFYVTQTINVEPLAAVREQLQQVDVKITYNDLLIKACSLALRKHPNVNSGFDSAKKAIIKFQTIDIAVAVSLPSGLLTPIIRHADFKNVGELSVEMRALAKRAKEGKLETQEYKGGSFTISNLGMYGVTDFIAIINPPQAAILAAGGIKDVAVVRNGHVVPGKVMNLTLSADHRVIDGVAAAEFLNTVKLFLENPAALLI